MGKLNIFLDRKEIYEWMNEWMNEWAKFEPVFEWYYGKASLERLPYRIWLIYILEMMSLSRTIFPIIKIYDTYLIFFYIIEH